MGGEDMCTLQFMRCVSLSLLRYCMHVSLGHLSDHAAHNIEKIVCKWSNSVFCGYIVLSAVAYIKGEVYFQYIL